MDAETQQILDFAEGRLDARLFSEALHTNPVFEAVMNRAPHLLADTEAGENLYLYVLGRNFRSPADLVHIHSILTRFLRRSGHPVNPTRVFADVERLIAAVQPRWLEVDPEYVQCEMLAQAGGRKGAALKRWLRDEFLMRFRFVDKPPQWLKSPRWPISANGPLVFLGQLPVKDYFHGQAAAYLFHDPASGLCETIVQVADQKPATPIPSSMLNGGHLPLR